MAKKITDNPDIYSGWGSNTAPYESMVYCLTLGKKEEEKAKIIQDFEESHTYLLICERGSWSPPGHILDEMYEKEQKYGVVGFVKVLMDWYKPHLDRLGE